MVRGYDVRPPLGGAEALAAVQGLDIHSAQGGVVGIRAFKTEGQGFYLRVFHSGVFSQSLLGDLDLERADGLFGAVQQTIQVMRLDPGRVNQRHPLDSDPGHGFRYDAAHATQAGDADAHTGDVVLGFRASVVVRSFQILPSGGSSSLN